VPQAWSLSLELYFYLIAPFIVRASLRRIIVLIVASLLLRLIAMGMFDLREDPWSYRFFPSELAFFLAGALVYRLHQTCLCWKQKAGILLLGLTLGAADLAGFWHAGTGFVSFLRVPIIAALIWGLPRLFDLTRNWKIDRYVGQLSYPLYISHLLVIWIFSMLAGPVTSIAGWFALATCALIVALLLLELVDQPCDKFRSAYIRVREQQFPVASVTS
jgi:peptidoglycan/LPS O-acetylase OafA/YrhL